MVSISQIFKDFIDNLKIKNYDRISNRYGEITKQLKPEPILESCTSYNQFKNIES